jgi:hypothetical protein
MGDTANTVATNEHFCKRDLYFFETGDEDDVVAVVDCSM